MNFLKKIFRISDTYEKGPEIRFGRFSDSYKEEIKYDCWDKSLEKFEVKEYLESFRLFLEYLSDDEEQNVKHEDVNGHIHFEIYQGSKKIIGFATEEHVKAEAKIADTEELKIGFLRRLVELNFGLKYSRYALDKEDNITMIFDTYMLDGSPYKMYYALKELAINADKQDDILLAEFDVLKPVNTGHIEEIDDNLKQIKYNFFIKILQDVIKQVKESDISNDQYPGAISYLLLDGVYKLDYMLRPEGYIMDVFEDIHRIYFRNDNKSAQAKNKEILKEIEKLPERSVDQIKSEMYRVKSTFGITAPTTHDRLVTYIDGEIKNMDWYMENRHKGIAQAIPSYIVGYSLFNYALPAADKEFLHLFYMILHQDFFSELGYTIHYRDGDNLRKQAILKSIQRITRKHQKDHPNLKPAKKILNFGSMVDFSKSYLLMVRDLNFDKEKK